MNAMEFADHESQSMIKATSRISSRGQIVIPIEIRKTLGLTEGDELTFRIDENGKINIDIVKKQRLSELFGILKIKRPFQPVDNIRKETYQKVAEKELQDGEED